MALNDDEKRPEAAPGGYAAGQAIGSGLRKVKSVVDRAEQVGQGVAAATADTVTAPFRRNANLMANVAAGVTGQPSVPYNPSPMQDRVAAARPEVYGLSRPAAPMSAAASPAAALPRPDFSFVAGGSSTVPGAPARGAVAPAVGGGGSSPAGGAPAPLVPGAPNTFTGSNGVTRPVPVATPTAGAQNAGAAPVLARPAAAQAPMQAPRMTVPGLSLPGVNTSRVRDSDAARDKLVKQIQDLAFRNGIGGLNSRGKRAFAADLLRLQGDLTNNQAGLAGQAAGQSLDAATRAGVATQGQVGDNQRALLGEAGENARTSLREAGTDRRTAVQESGANFRALNRPQLEVGADNTLVQVTGSRAETVRDEQGNAVKRPGAQLEPAQILAAYAEQQALMPIDPAAQSAYLQQLEASPLGQARAQVLSQLTPKANAPAPGTEQDGFRFKGGDPADPANWQKVK